MELDNHKLPPFCGSLRGLEKGGEKLPCRRFVIMMG